MVSCQHRYPEIQTCLKPSLISLPDPILQFFSLQKEMHYSEGKTKALISFHSFSFTNPLQPLPAEPHRVSEGSVLQLFHGEKRPSVWVFNENTTARVSFGLNKGHLLCKGGLRDCFGNKLAFLSPGSEFTCFREFIQDLKNKHIKTSW